VLLKQTQTCNSKKVLIHSMTIALQISTHTPKPISKWLPRNGKMKTQLLTCKIPMWTKHSEGSQTLRAQLPKTQRKSCWPTKSSFQMLHQETWESLIRRALGQTTWIVSCPLSCNLKSTKRSSSSKIPRTNTTLWLETQWPRQTMLKSTSTTLFKWARWTSKWSKGKAGRTWVHAD
jgi:hypothetical protein